MTDKQAYAGADLSNPEASFSVRGKETVEQAGTDRGGLAGATQQNMDEVNKVHYLFRSRRRSAVRPHTTDPGGCAAASHTGAGCCACTPAPSV